MVAFKERMYLRSFQEISKILSSTLSVDEVLDHIVRQITEVMNLERGHDPPGQPQDQPVGSWPRPTV